jgi:hypothetical protein
LKAEGSGFVARLLFPSDFSLQVSALPLKVCHKKQEKFHPTLETIDGKEP